MSKNLWIRVIIIYRITSANQMEPLKRWFLTKTQLKEPPFNCHQLLPLSLLLTYWYANTYYSLQFYTAADTDENKGQWAPLRGDIPLQQSHRIVHTERKTVSRSLSFPSKCLPSFFYSFAPSPSTCRKLFAQRLVTREWRSLVNPRNSSRSRRVLTINYICGYYYSIFSGDCFIFQMRW